MARDTERQWQVSEQVPGDESGDEDRGDGKVGDHHSAGSACQRDDRGDGGELVADGDGVGGLLGQISSAAAHGY